MRKLKNSELNRKSVAEFKVAEKNSLVVVLDNIRSLNNIGSVFRTSDAFLIKKVFLCGITACPPHNEIRKTALGADEAVDWENFEKTESAVRQLKAEGFILLATEQAENSTMLNHFFPKKGEKYALILGNEVKGVQQKIIDLCDFCIEIPQEGTKHSLNIAVSTGVVIWDLYSKMLTIKT